MKNLKLLKKISILLALVLCLGWTSSQYSAKACQVDCDECLDIYAACIVDCGTGNPTCAQACSSARNHCLIGCDSSKK